MIGILTHRLQPSQTNFPWMLRLYINLYTQVYAQNLAVRIGKLARVLKNSLPWKPRLRYFKVVLTNAPAPMLVVNIKGQKKVFLRSVHPINAMIFGKF